MWPGQASEAIHDGSRKRRGGQSLVEGSDQQGGALRDLTVADKNGGRG